MKKLHIMALFCVKSNVAIVFYYSEAKNLMANKISKAYISNHIDFTLIKRKCLTLSIDFLIYPKKKINGISKH